MELDWNRERCFIRIDRDGENVVGAVGTCKLACVILESEDESGWLVDFERECNIECDYRSGKEIDRRISGCNKASIGWICVGDGLDVVDCIGRDVVWSNSDGEIRLIIGGSKWEIGRESKEAGGLSTATWQCNIENISDLSIVIFHIVDIVWELHIKESIVIKVTNETDLSVDIYPCWVGHSGNRELASSGWCGHCQRHIDNDFADSNSYLDWLSAWWVDYVE